MFQDGWKKETNIRSIQKQDNTQIVDNQRAGSVIPIWIKRFER